jgi:hypothetical protein
MFDATNGVSRDYLDASMSLWDFVQDNFADWWRRSRGGELAILYRFETRSRISVRLYGTQDGQIVHITRPPSSTREAPVQAALKDLSSALALVARRLELVEAPSLPKVRDLEHFLEDM